MRKRADVSFSAGSSLSRQFTNRELSRIELLYEAVVAKFAQRLAALALRRTECRRRVVAPPSQSPSPSTVFQMCSKTVS